jgi:hypothetical protein
MASRLAGRVLTSSIAFLAAGMVDVLLYALGAPRRRARAKRQVVKRLLPCCGRGL